MPQAPKSYAPVHTDKAAAAARKQGDMVPRVHTRTGQPLPPVNADRGEEE